MKSLLKSALLATVLSGAVSLAHAGDISLEKPWSRATPSGAPVGAGYVTLKNAGAAADKLLSATAPDIAGKVEIHEMSMDGGVMKMREMPSGLPTPPGQSVELKPGGNHLMMTGLRAPLKEGQTLKATLRFEKAGEIPVEMKVEPIGAGAPGHKH